MLKGYSVYYPADDNPYELKDKFGYDICTENARAIREADAIHIFWDEKSMGSLFDLGCAFALNKPLVIVNKKDITVTEGKSFGNMLTIWENYSGAV